jgi:hypothetical protein
MQSTSSQTKQMVTVPVGARLELPEEFDWLKIVPRPPLQDEVGVQVSVTFGKPIWLDGNLDLDYPPFAGTLDLPPKIRKDDTDPTLLMLIPKEGKVGKIHLGITKKSNRESEVFSLRVLAERIDEDDDGSIDLEDDRDQEAKDLAEDLATRAPLIIRFFGITPDDQETSEHQKAVDCTVEIPDEF